MKKVERIINLPDAEIVVVSYEWDSDEPMTISQGAPRDVPHILIRKNSNQDYARFDVKDAHYLMLALQELIPFLGVRGYPGA